MGIASPARGRTLSDHLNQEWKRALPKIKIYGSCWEKKKKKNRTESEEENDNYLLYRVGFLRLDILNFSNEIICQRTSGLLPIM